MSRAIIFPGQGSQSVGMGKDLFKNSAEVRVFFEQASEILKEDMQKLCFEENAKLNLTQYTQPAILLVSYSVFSLVRKKLEGSGIAFGLGHSLGEFSALCASGALSFEKAIALVHKRGILMEEACKSKVAGMMVVLGLEDVVLEEFCEKKRNLGLKVWCANYNGDGQMVLGGSKEDLQDLEVELKGLGAKRALILPMSVASHCPALESICGDFKVLLEEALCDSFAFPIISNVNAKPYNSKIQALELLANQLVKPVLYKQSIRENDGAIDSFIECGGSVLKGLNKRLSKKDTLSLQTYAEIQDFLQKD
ncbi:ACP S-malonyltransferase [Helicobacter turcicus]|uniref:Malonyl CoA-acyl carrier protein transacylase n=1 Tax=Helicobacter turcicus TaxID=2867412 RepID=A0ABS7JP76_9HELI|nr:ACP S-malonyltransferase [Helicobacter turcicus]MBX7491197.1 ACP S-malonyltransferase [Helicobacter turcicus]MBX7546064.1 ACP S-malonyltransferase [Helicobacter turcicus]